MQGAKQERGKYLGNVVTPQNRRELMKNLKQAYIDQSNRRYAAEKEGDLDHEPPTEKELNYLAEAYAKFTVNKEQKHYKAYLEGKSFYKYRGQVFPVITEGFAKEARTAKQIIDINKVNTEEE